MEYILGVRVNPYSENNYDEKALEAARILTLYYLKSGHRAIEVNVARAILWKETVLLY